MSISSLVLDGVTMPTLSGYDTTTVIQGGMTEMADGTVSIDIVAPGLVGNTRRTYQFTWTLLSSTDASTVETAYNTLVDEGYVGMSSPEGETGINVQLVKGSQLKRKPVKIGDEFRYNMSFEVKRLS